MSDQRLDSIWWKILPLAISAGAVCIAIRSCGISNKALENSSRFFIAEKRPRLILQPHKVDEGEEYLTCSLRENKVQIRTQFVMKNLGKLTARSIKMERTIIEFPKLRETVSPSSVRVVLPPKISLEPGQAYVVCLDVEFSRPTQVQAAELHKAIDDRLESILVEFLYSYKSEVPGDEDYLTATKHLIDKQRALVLKSE